MARTACISMSLLLCMGVASAQVKVAPESATVTVGETLKLSADKPVTWSVIAPAGWVGSAGSVHVEKDGTALYDSPYPAPAAVTLVAASVADAKETARIGVKLVAPASSAGPALTVDGALTHSIDPLIYGMNDFATDSSLAALTDMPVSRWGGDAATPYNYKLDVTNAGADWYFETNPNDNTKYPQVSEVNNLVERNIKTRTVSIITVPLIGWTSLRKKGCAYPIDRFGPQEKVEPYGKLCGNGKSPDGKTDIKGSDPHELNMVIDEGWTRDWVRFLKARYGDAAHGGVAIYELDNEPEYWAGTHMDTHPAELTYDEVTQKGLTYAKAVKDGDPTSQVMGPVISDWTGYFYSHQDMMNGWHTGPCYCATGNPKDRLAHGDVPLMEYYLLAFKKAEAEQGTRLLDYLDLHAYYAPADAAFHPAGDTMLQKARVDATRAFWDPAYLGADTKDPDTREKGAKVIAPQIIPRMQRWIAKDYPGTKTAITEYAYGGQEHINGAIAQADVLGIFGREGLDLATLWGAPDPKKQETPGLAAFLIYRNYDGKRSKFGETGLDAASADQGRLSIYASKRKSDGAVTVIVLNKTYGDLRSAISFKDVKAGKSAKVFRYSNANLAAIEPVADAMVSGQGAGMGKIDAEFPAQSMTLFVLAGR